MLRFLIRDQRPVASLGNSRICWVWSDVANGPSPRHIARVRSNTTGFEWPSSPTALDSAPTFPFVFEEVVGFELRNAFQFQILIGMDILRQCDLTMTRDHRCPLQFGRS